MASKIVIKRSVTAAAPAGLSYGEMAFIQGSGLTANQFYVGISGGNPVWVGAQIGTTGTWTDNAAKTSLATQYATDQRRISSSVSSFNGLTGAVTGASLGANTFTALNSFNAGISASGGTFTSDIHIVNTTTYTELTVGFGGGGVYSNMAFGRQALFNNTIGEGNAAIGFGALAANTEGGGNIAIGSNTLVSNTTGSNNIAIGSAVLYWPPASSDNIAIGNGAMQGSFNYSPGLYNIGIGTNALKGSGFTGEANVAIGYDAVTNASTGSYNVAIGFESLRNNSTGLYNTSVGSGALRLGASISPASVSQMTALGYQAGRYRGTGTSSLTTGTGGIYIGYQARGSALAQTNEIVIGVDALGLGSNTAVIGATLQSAATIYGVLNLPSGLSAAGATFTGNVRAQSTLYTDNIQAIGNQINIANVASGRIAFGDYDGAGNSTYVFIRDGTSNLLISNPYGDVGIGDPNNVDSGYALLYNAAAGSLDGGNSSLTNFSSGSFGGLLTASAGISASGATLSGTVITSEKVNAITSARTVTVNFQNGNIQTLTGLGSGATGSSAIGFTGASATGSSTVTMIITNGGLMTSNTTFWSTAVKWPGGFKTTLSTSGVDILTFTTIDAGTNIYGMLGGKAFS